MRLQDELIALHAIADPPTRTYIFGQVPRLPIHFDSAEVADLLDRGVADSERTVAARALVAWARVGAQLTLHAYGLDPGRAGLWSTVAIKLSGLTPGAPVSEETPPDADSQRAGLGAVLEPCRAPLLALAGRAGADGEAARQILGLVPFQGADEVLLAGAGDPARAVGALLSLARKDPKLAARTLGSLQRLPGWILASAAGALNDRAALGIVLEAARSGDEHAAWAAADALPELAAGPAGAAGALEVAQTLAARRFGWVPAVLADSLGQLAPREGAAPAECPALTLLDGLLTGAGHDLVRVLAVRSMGAYRHDLSIRRASKCLERGSASLQAAAIEALVRLDHRPPELKGQLLERATKSTSLKLRGTAILGLMTHDRQAALRAAVDLVSSGEPAARVEGAFALGYLQSRTSLKLLNIVARKDPFAPSALQAEKSMAHYQEDQVSAGLVELLAHREPAVALAALRVLSHFPGEHQAALLPALEALEKKARPEVAREMLAECGRLGENVRGLPELLARPRTDAQLRAGALRGLIRSGAVPVEIARAAAAESAPELAVPGALALLVAGEPAGAQQLARWLADERGRSAAVRGLRDLAVVAGEAGRGGRFVKLQRLVGGRKPTTRKVAAMPPPEIEMPAALAARATPVGVKDDDPLLNTLADGAAVIEKVTGLLVKLSTERRGPVKKEKQWARELTYLHGPQTLWQRLAPYKALLPAAAIVGLVILFFVQQTAANIVAPEASVAVRRDALLGKVGTRVELAGKVTEVQPAKQTLLMTNGKLTVKVWLPSVDLKPVKVGSEVSITGLVKEPRTDPVVVHGFSLK